MVTIKLGELLGKRKMTRKELAQLVHARPNTICDLYNEKTKRVDIDLINRICTVLQCQISDIFEFVRDDAGIRPTLKGETDDKS